MSGGGRGREGEGGSQRDQWNPINSPLEVTRGFLSHRHLIHSSRRSSFAVTVFEIVNRSQQGRLKDTKKLKIKKSLSCDVSKYVTSALQHFHAKPKENFNFARKTTPSQICFLPTKFYQSTGIVCLSLQNFRKGTAKQTATAKRPYFFPVVFIFDFRSESGGSALRYRPTTVTTDPRDQVGRVSASAAVAARSDVLRTLFLRP